MEQIVGHRVSQSHGVAQVLLHGRDTWCVIRLYHLSVHRDFEERGSASSQLRDAKHRKRSGVGPTILPR
jgi:hypothetical protein